MARAVGIRDFAFPGLGPPPKASREATLGDSPWSRVEAERVLAGAFQCRLVPLATATEEAKPVPEGMNLKPGSHLSHLEPGQGPVKAFPSLPRASLGNEKPGV